MRFEYRPKPLCSNITVFDFYVAGAMRNCYPFGTRFVYITKPCTTSQCHFIRSHIRVGCIMFMCLAVTCHLYFWQYVTRGWNGYRNKNQHTKIDHGEENVPAAPAGTRTRDLLIMRPAPLLVYHNCHSERENAWSYSRCESRTLSLIHI